MVIISICTQGVSTLAWTWPPTQAGHMKASSKTILRAQKKHSQSQEKIETFKSLESWASENLLPLAKPVEKSWQPRDFLPDSSLTSDEFIDQVKCLRERTKELPDDYLVVLVGSMITEEALPTYQSWMNKHDGVGDETGACNTPWATWTRSWTAEENRHGDLLKTYLYLSGRVDMHMIEKTIQYLIGAGMDIGTEQDPYMVYVYTSLQERATSMSHGSLARLAEKGGDPTLARVCGTIAADEKRHEIAYERVVEKLLEVDPTETMIAIERMLRRSIKMPSHLMHDGHDPCLFNNFSVVAQRIGVYTVSDYINIIEFLIGRWRLEKLEGLTSEGKHAQEIVCGLPRKIGRLHERAGERVRKINLKFSWIYDRELSF